jgi:DNA invertase Pin-like site-specific DNA recombinase
VSDQLKALIYTRVSQDRAGGRSPEEQETEARAVCAAEGWTVVEVITDTVGASRRSKGTRAGWTRARKLVASGTVDVLVTWEASRAQRDLKAYAELRDLCVEHDVRWNYSGKTYDMARGDDRFRTGLDALLAEREAEEISERVRRATRANAANGRPHGRRVFGYRRVYDAESGRLIGQVPDEAQAPIVRRVFADYVAGSGPRTIADALQREGISTMTGIGPWTDEHIRRMLRSPAYAGQRVYQGEVIGKADWEPLVDADTWATAQARLAASRAAHPRVRGTDRLLSGVGRCGVCGAKVAVGHDRNKRKVYQCRSGHHVARDMVKLDAYVSAVLVAWLESPSSAEALAGATTVSDEAKAAATELQVLEARRADAVAMYVGGTIEASTLAAVEAELAPAIRAARKATQRDVGAALSVEVPDTGVEEWWIGLSDEVRRSIVGHLLTAVVIGPTHRGRRSFDPDAITIEFRA